MKKLRRRELYLVAILAAIVIVMSIGNAKFLSARNLQNIVSNNFEVGLICISMTMVILMAGMDMSVGSIAGFAGMLVSVLIVRQSMDVTAAILLCVIACAVIGAINGLMVIHISNANPMIITIGMMVLLRAVCRLFTEGYPVSGFPDSFNALSDGTIGGIKITVFILFLGIALGQWVLSKTLPGTYLYAIGNNEQSARFCGIKVAKVKFFTYVLSAVVAGMAGVFLTSRLQTGQPDGGEGYHMEAIAAIVIGGTSISGGEGNMIGTLLGFLIIASLKNGLSLLGVAPLTQMIFTGIVLLFTIFVNNVRKERESKRAQMRQLEHE